MSERDFDITFMDGTGLTVQGVTPILHIRKWVKTP
jgi:hypothetical protein